VSGPGATDGWIILRLQASGWQLVRVETGLALFTHPARSYPIILPRTAMALSPHLRAWVSTQAGVS